MGSDVARFKQKQFNNFVINQNILTISEQPRKLSSGSESIVYFNCRPAIQDQNLRQVLANFSVDFIQDSKINVQSVIGVPNGASMLGISTHQELLRRNNLVDSKEYPLLKAVEKDGKIEFFGEFPSSLIVQEDATSRALSGMLFADILRDKGVKVTDVITLIDRNMGTAMPGRDSQEVVDKFSMLFKKHAKIRYQKSISAHDAYKSIGIEYRPMSYAKDLIPAYFSRNSLDLEKLKRVQEEYLANAHEPLLSSKRQTVDRISDEIFLRGMSNMLNEPLSNQIKEIDELVVGF